MKYPIPTIIAAVLFSANCFGAEDNSKVIESSLFSAVIPSVMIENGGEWKGFSQSGAPDDLLISQGTTREFYTANVRVRRHSNINSLSDLKAETGVNGVPFAKATPVKMVQDKLLCVRPEMLGNMRPFPDGSTFTQVMACVDGKTDIYYELAVSWKARSQNRVYKKPPAGLTANADEFFASFKTR